MKNVLLSSDILQLEILLAEDDKDTASAYNMALEDRGHHVLLQIMVNAALKSIMIDYKIFD